MAMHTDLPIHKVAFDLLSLATDITRNIPRDFKAGLGARLNPTKTILQPIDRGVDFVGHVIKPWRRTTRPRSVAQALKRTAAAPVEQLRETANSYFGLLTQASHSQKDRSKLANLLLRRGQTVNGALTKTYAKS